MQTDMLTESQKSKFNEAVLESSSWRERLSEWHLTKHLEGGTAIDIKARDPNDVAVTMIEELLKIKAGEMLLTDIDKY